MTDMVFDEQPPEVITNHGAHVDPPDIESPHDDGGHGGKAPEHGPADPFASEGHGNDAPADPFAHSDKTAAHTGAGDHDDKAPEHGPVNPFDGEGHGNDATAESFASSDKTAAHTGDKADDYESTGKAIGDGDSEGAAPREKDGPTDPFESVFGTANPTTSAVPAQTGPEHAQLPPDDDDHSDPAHYYQTPTADLHLVSALFDADSARLGLTVPVINGVVTMREHIEPPPHRSETETDAAWAQRHAAWAQREADHNVTQIRLALHGPQVDVVQPTAGGPSSIQIAEPGRNVVSAMTLLPPLGGSEGVVTAETARRVIDQELGAGRASIEGLPRDGDVHVIVRGVTEEMRERTASHENHHARDVRDGVTALLHQYNAALSDLAGQPFSSRAELAQATIRAAGLSDVRVPAGMESGDPLTRLAAAIQQRIAHDGGVWEQIDASNRVDGISDARYDAASRTLTVTLAQLHPSPAAR